MLYQEYKKKMMKLVRILEFIRKYRFLIISVAVTVVVLTGAFLITKGMVFANEPEKETFEYGESLDFKANAMFGKVWYEYRYRATAEQPWSEWSNTPTDQIGEHSVRAFGQNVFGKNRYGKEYKYVITPRAIVIDVFNETVTYGDLPVTVADRLAFDDKITCNKYIYGDLTEKSTSIEPDLVTEGAFVITNKDGVDVTKSYIITHKADDTIAFNKRPITITIASDTKNYDGTELKAENFDITEGSLAFEDSIKVTKYPSQTNIGTAINDPSPLFAISITTTKTNVNTDTEKPNEVDVTSNYEIKLITGVLTVEKRPVKVHTGSEQFVYDGGEHKNTSYTVDESTPLVEGHTIEVVESTGIKNVTEGILYNQFTIKIFDKDGNEVTENYVIKYELGKLEVLPKAVQITTHDGNWVYDGKEHWQIDYTPEGLIDTHVLEAVDKKVVKNALDEPVPNEVSYKIMNGEQDVTANYQITYTYGTLNVTKRPISLKSNKFENTYEDKEYRDSRELEILSLAKDEGLAEGHTIEVTYTAALTDVGTIDNTYDVEIYAGDEKVTENYDINKVNDKLIVNPRKIDISGKGATKMYDGEVLFCHDYILNSGDGVLDTHMVKYVSASTALDVDDDVINVIEIEIFDKLTESIEKTSNYEITYNHNQKLVITPRPITVTADSLTEVYDGTEKRLNTYTISTDPGLAPNQTAEVTISGACKNVKDSPVANVVVSVVIYDKNGEKVKDCNYDITKVNGTITILPRPITFVSADAEKIYDAYPLTKEEAWVKTPSDPKKEGLVSGQNAKYDFTGEITDVLFVDGKVAGVDNTFTATIWEGDEDTTSNYKITYENGTLTVNPRPIVLISESKDKIYDDVALVHHVANVGIIDNVNNYGLADNPITGDKQAITYYFTGTLTDVIRLDDYSVGSTNNEFTAQIGYGTKNTTSNYTISYVYGKLRVDPRPICVISQDASRVYNGLDLYNKNVILNENSPYMSLVSYHYYTVEKYATINDVGSVDNEVEIAIYDYYSYYDDDKTSNYDITYEFGTLTVTKRNIVVVTDSAEKTYDGKPLVCPTFKPDPNRDGYSVSDDGLAHGMYGQRIELETTGTITFVGQTENTIKQDENGVDIVNIFDGTKNVTHNYNVTTQYGTLKVNKRTISLTAENRTKEYDGTPLYGSDPLTVGFEGLGHGDTITATYIGSQTDVGTSPVYIDSFIIMHEGYDQPVNFCYDVVEMNSGILEVTPRWITIKASDASKLYDDTPLTSDGFEIVSEKNLVLDHYVKSIAFDGSQLDAGEGSNTPHSAIISDGNGRDVTFNYHITYESGLLKVTPRKIKVITGSSEHIYDDTMFTFNSGYIHPGYGDGILSTQKATLDITGYGVDAGEHTNTYTIKITRKSDNSDVTHNYLIDEDLGILVIKPRVIDIYTGSAEKVYDGTYLTESSYSVDYSSLLSTHKIVNVTTTGKQLTAGSSHNTAQVIIVRKNDTSYEVSKNYVLNEECYGILTVTKATITVQTFDKSKQYDGTPLTYKEYAVHANNLLAAHTYDINVTGTITEVGTTPNTFEVNKIYLGDIDVTESFEVMERLGTLEVTMPPLAFQSSSSTKTYDGYELYDHYAMMISGVLKPGHEPEYAFTGSILNVLRDENGEVIAAPNYFTVKIVDENGNDVTEEYGEITYFYGDLKITPVDIQIKAKNEVKEYDGTPLYSPLEIVEPNVDLENLNFGLLYDRFTWAVLRPSASRTEVGITEYVIADGDFQIYLDGEAVPMTNFNIECEAGKLRVVEKLLIVNLWEHSKVYDGQPVSYGTGEWYISKANNPDGIVVDMDLQGSLTNAGTIDIDQLAFDLYEQGEIKIYTKDGVDVTNNYAVTFESNVPLTVKKKPIEITVASVTKIYDGKELTAHSLDVTGLIDGHYIDEKYIIYTGSITAPGIEKNTITTLIIRDQDGNDVTDNYEPTINAGELVVLEKPN